MLGVGKKISVLSKLANHNSKELLTKKLAGNSEAVQLMKAAKSAKDADE
jgi:hypothetical protein